MKSNSLRKFNVFMLIICTLLLLVSCGQASASTNEPPDKKIITDREGNAITQPEKIEKIISMAPSITETLIHLGLGDKLCAVDMYSVNIPGVPENLPAYDIMAPDIESIAALKPDIIFVTGMSRAEGDDPYQPITDLGVFITYIPSPSSIEGIKNDIRFIGEITDTASKAESIISDLENEINDITGKIANDKSSRTVYFELSEAPYIYSFGKGTFLNEMIELLGAENILSDQHEWVSVSEETVIDRNPDIIFTNVGYIDEPVNEILGRNGWDVINAVKNKRVYLIDNNASSQPNEYISIAFRQMAEALYPDLFN